MSTGERREGEAVKSKVTQPSIWRKLRSTNDIL